MSETPPAENPDAPAAEAEDSPATTALILLFTLAVLGGFLFAIAMFALPPLMHAIDSGQATVDAAEFVPGFAPASRNVTVKGRALIEMNVQRTAGKRGSAGTASVFFPVVPAAWKPGQPVRIVASAEEFPTEKLEALAGATEIKGVLATAPLEGLVYGLPDNVRQYLRSKHKLALADDAVLLRVAK